MWIQSVYFTCNGREPNNASPARLNSSATDLWNRKMLKSCRRGMENDWKSRCSLNCIDLHRLLNNMLRCCRCNKKKLNLSLELCEAEKWIYCWQQCSNVYWLGSIWLWWEGREWIYSLVQGRKLAWVADRITMQRALEVNQKEEGRARDKRKIRVLRRGAVNLAPFCRMYSNFGW